MSTEVATLVVYGSYAPLVDVGGHGGADLPKDDIDRVKSHLAKYYEKMGDTAPWERETSG
jgi:hypothetical protein